VRAASRRKEMAIRLSMGASRGRLLSQLMTESLLLACLGGACGLLIGFWVRDLLWSLRPPFFRNFDLNLSLDYRVLLFTLGVSLATGLLFGLAPALETARATWSTSSASAARNPPADGSSCATSWWPRRWRFPPSR
jgi:ABC-type antimicrobial peptide transport system permease subunit